MLLEEGLNTLAHQRLALCDAQVFCTPRSTKLVHSRSQLFQDKNFLFGQEGP